MVLSKASFSAIVASCALIATVHGHGYMSVPKVEFTFIGDTTQYMGSIESSASGFSGTFSGSPADNTAAFNKGIGASKYKSLKEFLMDKTKVGNPDWSLECGYTNPKGTAQPVPEEFVEWSHGAGEGFTSSHEGPCEVWCDDTRVFQDDDCPKNFPTAPAKLPYDHDACLGSSQLTLYWIALHSASWQVYINCAPLEKTTSTGAKSKFAVGSSGGSSKTPATESSTTGGSAAQNPETPETPSSAAQSSGGSSAETPSTPEAPSTPTTEAPSTPTTEAPSTPTTEAPSTPTTEAPSVDTPVVTPAPNAGDSKCSVRRRRRN